MDSSIYSSLCAPKNKYFKLTVMDRLFSFWHFDIALILFIVIITLLYFYTIKFTLVKQYVYFFIGLLVIILAVASPLHFLGEYYLFSAHMITHILLLLIAPPLMILGIPEENRFQKSLQLISKKIVAMPLMSWLCGIGIMWFWHIPYIYHHFLTMQNMGDDNSSIMIWHNVHMLSLWIAGIIFWWVIINPYKQYQLKPLTGVLYLSTACILCSLLGLLITFAPPNMYNYQMVMSDKYGFNNIIKNKWEISGAMDQQIAGLIMWVPCCFIYLTAAMLLLKKWFNEKEEITPTHNLNNLIKNATL